MGGEFLLKIGVKKFGKKEDEIISLSPFSEENGLTPGEERYNGKAGKKFEKKLEKIWRLKKSPYLCSRFREGELGGTIESERR